MYSLGTLTVLMLAYPIAQYTATSALSAYQLFASHKKGVLCPNYVTSLDVDEKVIFFCLYCIQELQDLFIFVFLCGLVFHESHKRLEVTS